MNTFQCLGKKTAIIVVLGATVCLGALSARATGPTSELYLTPNQNSVVAIQGANVLFNVAQSPVGNSQSPVAVNSTVRTLALSSFNGHVGGEYSLSTGAPTSVTYPFPAASGSAVLYDGTTDGTYNYSLDFNTGTVYRFDLDWSGGTVLFTLGTSSGLRMGLTYDPSNNSLWIGGYSGSVGTLIADYSLSGTLLSSFKVGHDSNAGLALDPADGTLWLVNLHTSGQTLLLEQYARSAAGSFGATQAALNSQTYPGVFNSAFGAEFRYIAPPPILQITSITHPASNTIHLLGIGAPSAVNRIESSSTPNAAGFTTLGSVMTDNTGAIAFDDTNAGTEKFYRLAYP